MTVEGSIEGTQELQWCPFLSDKISWFHSFRHIVRVTISHAGSAKRHDLLRKNVVLALECSTFSTLMDAKAFKMLGQPDWFGRSSGVLNICIIAVACSECCDFFSEFVLLGHSIFLSCVQPSHKRNPRKIHNWMIPSSVTHTHKTCGTPKAGGLCHKTPRFRAVGNSWGFCFGTLSVWTCWLASSKDNSLGCHWESADARLGSASSGSIMVGNMMGVRNYIIDGIFNSFVFSKLWWGLPSKWLRLEFMNVGEISHLTGMILPRVCWVDLLCTQLDFASSNPRLMTLWDGIFGFTFLKSSREV